MNIALWISQTLLALVFPGSGSAKATMSKERMIATGQSGVAPYPLPFIRTIAVLEVIGAVGLILPQLTGVAPVLTPIAAIGLAGLMVGAGASHLSIGEYKQTFGVNLILLLICVFVAWGRLAGF